MVTTLIWHGSPQESLDLVAAVTQNCDCEFGPMGMKVQTCSAHGMLTNQRSLDRLLFVRHIADLLQREEWAASGEPCHTSANSETTNR